MFMDTPKLQPITRSRPKTSEQPNVPSSSANANVNVNNNASRSSAASSPVKQVGGYGFATSTGNSPTCNANKPTSSTANNSNSGTNEYNGKEHIHSNNNLYRKTTRFQKKINNYHYNRFSYKNPTATPYIRPKHWEDPSTTSQWKQTLSSNDGGSPIPIRYRNLFYRLRKNNTEYSEEVVVNNLDPIQQGILVAAIALSEDQNRKHSANNTKDVKNQNNKPNSEEKIFIKSDKVNRTPPKKGNPKARGNLAKKQQAEKEIKNLKNPENSRPVSVSENKFLKNLTEKVILNGDLILNKTENSIKSIDETKTSIAAKENSKSSTVLYENSKTFKETIEKSKISCAAIEKAYNNKTIESTQTFTEKKEQSNNSTELKEKSVNSPIIINSQKSVKNALSNSETADEFLKKYKPIKYIPVNKPNLNPKTYQSERKTKKFYEAEKNSKATLTELLENNETCKETLDKSKTLVEPIEKGNTEKTVEKSQTSIENIEKPKTSTELTQNCFTYQNILNTPVKTTVSNSETVAEDLKSYLQSKEIDVIKPNLKPKTTPTRKAKAKNNLSTAELTPTSSGKTKPAFNTRSKSKFSPKAKRKIAKIFPKLSSESSRDSICQDTYTLTNSLPSIYIVNHSEKLNEETKNKTTEVTSKTCPKTETVKSTSKFTDDKFKNNIKENSKSIDLIQACEKNSDPIKTLQKDTATITDICKKNLNQPLINNKATSAIQVKSLDKENLAVTSIYSTKSALNSQESIANVQSLETNKTLTVPVCQKDLSHAAENHTQTSTPNFRFIERPVSYTKPFERCKQTNSSYNSSFEPQISGILSEDKNSLPTATVQNSQLNFSPCTKDFAINTSLQQEFITPNFSLILGQSSANLPLPSVCQAEEILASNSAILHLKPTEGTVLRSQVITVEEAISTPNLNPSCSIVPDGLPLPKISLIPLSRLIATEFQETTNQSDTTTTNSSANTNSNTSSSNLPVNGEHYTNNTNNIFPIIPKIATTPQRQQFRPNLVKRKRNISTCSNTSNTSISAATADSNSNVDIVATMNTINLKNIINTTHTKYDEALKQQSRKRLREEIRIQLKSLNNNLTNHKENQEFNFVPDEIVDSINIPSIVLEEIRKAIGLVADKQEINLQTIGQSLLKENQQVQSSFRNTEKEIIEDGQNLKQEDCKAIAAIVIKTEAAEEEATAAATEEAATEEEATATEAATETLTTTKTTTTTTTTATKSVAETLIDSTCSIQTTLPVSTSIPNMVNLNTLLGTRPNMETQHQNQELQLPSSSSSSSLSCPAFNVKTKNLHTTEKTTTSSSKLKETSSTKKHKYSHKRKKAKSSRNNDNHVIALDSSSSSSEGSSSSSSSSNSSSSSSTSSKTESDCSKRSSSSAIRRKRLKLKLDAENIVDSFEKLVLPSLSERLQKRYHTKHSTSNHTKLHFISCICVSDYNSEKFSKMEIAKIQKNLKSSDCSMSLVFLMREIVNVFNKQKQVAKMGGEKSSPVRQSNGVGTPSPHKVGSNDKSLSKSLCHDVPARNVNNIQEKNLDNDSTLQKCVNKVLSMYRQEIKATNENQISEANNALPNTAASSSLSLCSATNTNLPLNATSKPAPSSNNDDSCAALKNTNPVKCHKDLTTQQQQQQNLNRITQLQNETEMQFNHIRSLISSLPSSDYNIMPIDNSASSVRFNSSVFDYPTSSFNPPAHNFPAALDLESLRKQSPIGEAVVGKLREIDLKLMELHKRKMFIEEMILKLQKDKMDTDLLTIKLQNEKFILLNTAMTVNVTNNSSSSSSNSCNTTKTGENQTVPKCGAADSHEDAVIFIENIKIETVVILDDDEDDEQQQQQQLALKKGQAAIQGKENAKDVSSKVCENQGHLANSSESSEKQNGNNKQDTVENQNHSTSCKDHISSSTNTEDIALNSSMSKGRPKRRAVINSELAAASKKPREETKTTKTSNSTTEGKSFDELQKKGKRKEKEKEREKSKEKEREKSKEKENEIEKEKEKAKAKDKEKEKQQKTTIEDPHKITTSSNKKVNSKNSTTENKINNSTPETTNAASTTPAVTPPPSPPPSKQRREQNEDEAKEINNNPKIQRNKENKKSTTITPDRLSHKSPSPPEEETESGEIMEYENNNDKLNDDTRDIRGIYFNLKNMPVGFFTHSKSPITQVKFYENKIIASGENGKIYIYNASTLEPMHTHNKHAEAITHVHICEDKGFLFTTSLDGYLKKSLLQNLSSGTESVYLKEPLQTFDIQWDIAYIGSRWSNIYTCHIMSNIRSATLLCSTDSSIITLKAAKEGARKVLIITSKGHLLHVRDATSGLLLRTFDVPDFINIYSILLNEGTLYCGTQKKEIRKYDFVSGAPNGSISCGNGAVSMLMFRNKFLFVGCYDGYIYILDKETGRQVSRLTGSGKIILTMEILGDKIITSAKDCTMKIINIPTFCLDNSL